MGGRTLIRTLCALAPLAFLASCAEYPTPPPTVAPTPPPMGYWNGDGVPGSPKIVVSISEQHAYFYKGKHLVGESTVSTGKPGFGTPPGQYTVLSKDAAHVSTVFGDYVDEFGNVVKSNIDSRKDSKPPGSHYDGARMPFAMFFRGGYAMHQGYVPPYAASHGCIRVPKEMAETFFDNAPVGTPVIVKEEAVMQSVAAPPPLPPTVPPVVSGPPIYSPPPPRMVTSTAPASVRPAIVRSTVPAPTPIPLRSPAPPPVRPATVRSTVPAPTPPIPLRSPTPATVPPVPPAPVVSPTPKKSVKAKTKHHIRSRPHHHSSAPSPSPTPTR
jgi:hypothetical protein